MSLKTFSLATLEHMCLCVCVHLHSVYKSVYTHTYKQTYKENLAEELMGNIHFLFYTIIQIYFLYLFNEDKCI